MTIAQILAVAIFIAMFLLIVIDKIERQYVTLGCGALTLILVFGVGMRSTSAIWRTLNLQQERLSHPQALTGQPLFLFLV